MFSAGKKKCYLEADDADNFFNIIFWPCLMHIQVAVFYFHDEFTWLKGAGLSTIMVGVSLFNWYK